MVARCSLASEALLCTEFEKQQCANKYDTQLRWLLIGRLCYNESACPHIVALGHMLQSMCL